MEAACRMIVTGYVQGVGFRWYTQRQARALDCAGWVRNRPDGTVEVWAEGSEENLERLEEAVRRGPSGSRVVRIEISPAVPTGRYFQFDITF